MIGLFVVFVFLVRGGVFGSFIFFGAFGLAWAAIWYFVVMMYFKDCKMVGVCELNYIVDFFGGVFMLLLLMFKDAAFSFFKLLLFKVSIWACIIVNFVNNWGFFIFLVWMLFYFK